MRLETIVVGIVLLASAAGAASLLWLRRPDPMHELAAQVLREPPPAPASLPRALTLHFDYDRAALLAEEAQDLQQWLRAARRSGFKRIDAVGHADRIGSPAYNMALSQRRADAVKAYLVEKSVAPLDVRARARGEREPASGDACVDMGPEARGNAGLVECLRPDRRVEVLVIIDS